MPTRTFLALDLDDGIRDGLEASQRAIGRCGAKLRAVERSNLHVTLMFLGDVADELLADVCNLAEAVAGEIEPFDFSVRGLVAVPPRGTVRMVWAGVDDPTGRMALLQGNLTEAFAGLGLRQEERSFKPHITLARVRSPAGSDQLRREVQQWADKDFGILRAREVAVYASQLTHDGPVYSPLARPALGQ